MPRLPLAILAAGLVLGVAAPAQAATTANFAFKHGEANRVTGITVPGAYTPPAPRNPPEGVPPCIRNGTPGYGAPGCTYEVHEFEVKPEEQNGKFTVSTVWADKAQDWDLYVYFEDEDGNHTEVAASASVGGTTKEENAIYFGPSGAPIPPGKYVIFMDNWSSDDPEWEGFVSFEPYVPINVRPLSSFTAPETAAPGQPVTFDARTSTDPDGTIREYAWDFDGNGSFETSAGSEPVYTRAFDRGPVSVGLRVTDDREGAAYSSRVLRIEGGGSTTGGGTTGGGTTGGTTTGPPGGTRPATLTVRRTQRLQYVRRRGVRATLDCFQACRATARLVVGGRVVGRGARSLPSADTVRLDARLTASGRRLLARTRRVRATLRVTIAEGGTTRTITRRITLRR